MNPFDPSRKDVLASKTTLITGGATGLGRAMAERMAGLGAKIAVIGRRPEPLAETAKAIRDAGGEAVGISADVRDPEAVARAVEEAEKSLGPINQLITTPQAISSPRPRICRPTPSTRWCRSSSTEPSIRPRRRQAAHRAGREARGAPSSPITR
jgi:hypothetical protein